MTTEEIKSGNKIIAEFIGGKVVLSHVVGTLNVWQWKGERVEEFRKLAHMPTLGISQILLEHCVFHSSWDSLMPVWKKLSYEVYEHRHKLSAEDYKTANELTRQMLSAFQKTEIETAWLTLIEFIQFYNQHLKL